MEQRSSQALALLRDLDDDTRSATLQRLITLYAKGGDITV